MAGGLSSLLRRLRSFASRREVNVWYHSAFRLPLGGVEATGMDARRADLAAWWLLQTRAVARSWWRTPRRATWGELARVHSSEMLESIGRPDRLAAVFGVDRSDIPVDELLRTVRLGVGATVQAAREALRRSVVQFNLLGGFHHAGPEAAGGNCPVNDVAVAVAAVREEGFRGRVVVIDLDAHPPDGIADCLARDPSAWIGSLSGSDWGPMPGVDETVLPKGTGDAEYMAALRALLDRMPEPDLAFVIAGGDVVAGDAFGMLGLTLAGVRRRDLAVAARLESVPSVWLSGGGYGKNSWRTLAGTGMALATGSHEPIPAEVDPLSTQFASIARSLAQEQFPPASDELSEEDLAEALGMPTRRQRLFLGQHTAASLEMALQRFGLLDQMARLGYSNFRVAFDRSDPGERLRVYGESEGEEHVLVEVVLERQRVAGHPVLYIHWLSLRNPRARFSDRHPALPGQEVPGLGLAREIGEILALLAIQLGLTGVAFRPAHYHTAYASRRLFSFLDPARQGRFEALIRDVEQAGLGLREATAAVDEGRVLLDGAPYKWEPDEMVMWLREPPEEPGEVDLARESARFTIER